MHIDWTDKVVVAQVDTRGGTDETDEPPLFGVNGCFLGVASISILYRDLSF